MKIGLISDTHGDIATFRKLLGGPFSDADFIVHTGDVLNHGPRNPLPKDYDPGGLTDLINALEKPLFVVQGNCDSEVDRMFLDIPLSSPYLLMWMEGFSLLAHHGHLLGPDEIKRLAPGNLTTVVVSGHTHIPEIEREGDIVYVNPGSPALPKGEKIPTAGLLEAVNGKINISLVRLENFEELDSLAVT